MSIRRFCGRTRLLLQLLIFLVICTLFTLYRNSGKGSSSLSEIAEQRRRFRYKLIVVILSGPHNFEQREAARQTWLSKRYNNVKHAFVIGVAGGGTSEQERLALENESRKDLLLLPNLRDSYETLTKKVLQSFTHIHKGYDFDFLLKCDDDSYVLVDRVLEELERWQGLSSGNELYWGFFNGKAQVKRNGLWKESEWIFCDFYLPYALGGGYVLSSNLVKFIGQNSEILRLYNSEDVSVGLWLAPLNNIERKHDVRFDTEYRSRGCSNEYIITHKQTVESMKTMYQIYKTSGTLCRSEIRYRNSYVYDWHVPPSKCCIRRSGIP